MTAAIYWVVMRLATEDRARSFKGVSPGLLPPISIIFGAHQLKPDIGGALARRWYDVEQVDLIVDVPVSAVGLAVQGIANEK